MVEGRHRVVKPTALPKSAIAEISHEVMVIGQAQAKSTKHMIWGFWSITRMESISDVYPGFVVSSQSWWVGGWGFSMGFELEALKRLLGEVEAQGVVVGSGLRA